MAGDPLQRGGAAFHHRSYVLGACLLATFMAAIEATIVATAMPTIVGRLGGFALLGWVFAVYLMAQAVTVPIYGRLADLYGRKPVFLAGASLFLIGSILCGWAGSMTALVVFRAIQGLGAGAILPISMTIVADVYTSTERAAVQAYLAGVWGFSAIAGPLLGALIVQYLPWSFIFWLNIPVGVAAMAMLVIWFREPERHRARKLDFVGAGLLATTILPLLLALLESHLLGMRSVGLAAVSALSFAALWIQQRRAEEPLFPHALWRDPTLAAGTAGSLTIGAAMMATSAFLPTYVQGVMGGSAIAAGATLALMSLGWPLANLLAARLMRRHSYRLTALAGSGALLLGSLMLPQLGVVGGLAWACVSASFIGAGMGMCNTTFLVSVQNTAAPAIRGIATAATNFMRLLGAALGTAVLGSVLNLSLGDLPGVQDPVQTLMDPARRHALPAAQEAVMVARVDAALRAVFWAACVFAVATLAVSWRVPRGTRPGSEARRPQPDQPPPRAL